ncbi:MAG: MFS transporter [Saprospiraceae bacterium]|nr:MFS transporter [Saprospiraceae bacterium]
MHKIRTWQKEQSKNLFFVPKYLPPEKIKTNIKYIDNLGLDVVQPGIIAGSCRPLIFLFIIGLLFNVYNSIKQGIVVIYFTHYLNNQLLAATFMVGLMLASIAGAMLTSPLGKKFGKRNLFIYALIFSGVVNSLLFFCGPDNNIAIFTLGIISEMGAAVFPTLFFAMLGDAADYSEYKNKRRATGLVYSAGSFATKFGGGIAGAIIGFVLASFHYNGQDEIAIQGAIPGIIMLMSWIPAIIAFIAAGFMTLYPLTQTKMDEITNELNNRRIN